MKVCSKYVCLPVTCHHQFELWFRYSMIFDDDTAPAKKKKKDERTSVDRNRKKKKYDSESEEEFERKEKRKHRMLKTYEKTKTVEKLL